MNLSRAILAEQDQRDPWTIAQGSAPYDGYPDRNKRLLDARIRTVKDDRVIYRAAGDAKMVAACDALLAGYSAIKRNNDGQPFLWPAPAFVDAAERGEGA